MVDEKIKAVMIIEALGRPAEYLAEHIKTHIGRLKEAKDVEVLSEKFNEPREIAGTPGLFTTFSEVEVSTVNFAKLLDIVFDYMPSSIEIIEPEDLTLSLAQATGFLGDLSGRLHKYDEIAKIAKLQTQQLMLKLNELQKKIPTEQKIAVEKPKKKAAEKKAKKKGKKK